MNSIKTGLLFLLVVLSSFQHVPELEMIVGEGDSIGDNESEQCFGCGDCSIYCAIGKKYTVHSSSSLKEQGQSNYSSTNLDDYNLQTAWIEGRKGDGIGEWIEFRFDHNYFQKSDIELNGLYLFNGYRKNLNTWNNNSRVRKMKMIINGKEFAILLLKDSYKIQSTKFASLKLKEIKTIRFEIIEVYAGDKYADVALSELKFEGVHHH